MKKTKYLLLLCTLSFMLTGCVKFNVNMDIKKDKSMDFSIVYAFDTSVFGDEQVLEDEQKKELENQGFTITDYVQDKMKGFALSKKIKNIDEVSSTTDTEYSLSGIADSNSENKYIFKVKKGILKNTYTAKLKFNASDSDLNDSQDDLNLDASEDDTTIEGVLDNDETDTTILDDSLNNDESFTTTLDESLLDTEDLNDEDSLDSSNDLSDMDFSNMMSNMDLSFSVNLPYKATSSNATTKENNDKSLKWNLSSTEVETIEFEFDLYNMTNIYIGAGVLALLFIIIIAVLVSKKKNNDLLKAATINPQPTNEPTIDNESTSPVGQSENIETQAQSIQEPLQLNQDIHASVGDSYPQNEQGITEDRQLIVESEQSIYPTENASNVEENIQEELQSNQNIESPIIESNSQDVQTFENEFNDINNTQSNNQ